MKNNRFARQTYARLFRRASTIAIVGIAVAVLFWPTRARRVKDGLNQLAEALACDGPLSSEHEQTLRRALVSHLSARTTVTMQEPETINEALSFDDLVRQFASLCATTSHFRTELSHIVVDVSEHGANARADVAIQYAHGGRTEREHRKANFVLSCLQDGFRLASVELGPNIVNQPEPRP